MFRNSSIHSMTAEQTSHFSLRKIGIGLASVLIGTSLYFISSNAHVVQADTIEPNTEQASAQLEQTDATDNALDTPVSDTAAYVNQYKDTESIDTNVTDSVTGSAIDTTVDKQQSDAKPVNTTGSNASNTSKPKDVAVQAETPSEDWYDYDESTNTLNIHGNKTFENPDKLFGLYNQYGQKVQQINIANKTTIIGSAENLFASLTNLTNITGLSNLDTKQVTNMNGMFSGCGSLTSIDISKFDFSNVKTMDEMFGGSGIKHLDLSNHIAPELTSMNFVCAGMPNLESVDLSNFVTGKPTSLGSFFVNDGELLKVNFDGFETNHPDLNPDVINTENAILDQMFQGCSNIRKIDFSKAKIRNISIATDMIMECDMLTEADLTGLDLLHGYEGPANVHTIFVSVPNLRIVTLGPQSILYTPKHGGAAFRELEGTWFNKGNGTIRQPQGNKAWTSDDFVTNYNPETDADTYVRMFDFHINFIDQNNNNQNIEGVDSIVVDVLSISPEGADLHIPHFTVERPENVQDIIAKLEAKGYELVKDPFGDKDAINPTMQQTDLNFEFKHKSDPQVQEIDKNYVVHFVDANGKTLAPDHVQTVHFKRTVQISRVNGKVLDETVPWTTTNEYYDDVAVPQIDGYVPQATTANGSTVAHGKLAHVQIVPGQDVTDSIVYTARSSETGPVADSSTNESNHTGETENDPHEPETNPDTSHKPGDATKPPKPTTGTKPSQDRKPNKPTTQPVQHAANALKPHKDLNPTGDVNSMPAAAINAANIVSAKHASLPQTGTKDNRANNFLLAIVGVIILGVSFAFKPKRKK